jgi:hypothetical protein
MFTSAEFNILLKEIKISQLEIDLALDKAFQVLSDRVDEAKDAKEAKTLVRNECKENGILDALEIPLRKHGELIHKLADQTAILNKRILDWTE